MIEQKQHHPDMAGQEFTSRPDTTDEVIDLRDAERVHLPTPEAYMLYWAHRVKDLGKTDPERTRHAVQQQVIIGALKSHVIDRGVPVPRNHKAFRLMKRQTSLAEQAQYWVHSFGPDNDLVGATGGLERAADLMLEGDTEVGRSKAALYVDAASSLFTAARVEEDAQEKVRLRQKGRAAIETFIDDPEVSVFKNPAEFDNAQFMLQEAEFDELYEAYLDPGLVEGGPESPEEFRTVFAQTLLRNIKSFHARLHAEHAPAVTGITFERWFVLENRLARLRTTAAEDLHKVRFRAAEVHEDEPWDPRGAPSKLSEAFDVAVDVLNEDTGEYKTATKIQFKTHDNDPTKYRKPIVVVNFRSNRLDTNRAKRGFIKRTVTQMLTNEPLGAEDKAVVESVVDPQKYLAAI